MSDAALDSQISSYVRVANLKKQVDDFTLLMGLMVDAEFQSAITFELVAGTPTPAIIVDEVWDYEADIKSFRLDQVAEIKAMWGRWGREGLIAWVASQRGYDVATPIYLYGPQHTKYLEALEYLQEKG